MEGLTEKMIISSTLIQDLFITIIFINIFYSKNTNLSSLPTIATNTFTNIVMQDL